MKRRVRNKIERHPFDADGRFAFVNVKTHKRQICRIDAHHSEASEFDDYMMAESGCSSEILEGMRSKDRREGCSNCMEAGMP